MQYIKTKHSTTQYIIIKKIYYDKKKTKNLSVINRSRSSKKVKKFQFQQLTINFEIYTILEIIIFIRHVANNNLNLI